jgi:MFS family permease
MVFAILAQDQTVFYLVFALRGVYASGSFLSGMNINFDFSKPEIRPTYIGLSNTVIGVFSGVAPLIGGLLAGWLDYTWMFGIAAVLSLLGFVTLRYWVVEPRKTRKLTID